MYQSMKVEGNKIILEFDTFCKAKGNELKGFIVAGADRKFVPAQAKIFKGGVPMPGNQHAHAERQMIAVWNPDVNKPVAVRYGWSDKPQNCTLYGETGLPASPFRTDDWPGVTDNVK
jgi:sialate O-acetylesterase